VYYTCDHQEVPRPATGKTPVRSVRVAEAIWRPALERARAEGKTITQVITELLRKYGAEWPPARDDR
jgi:hypothetical protein